MGSKPEWIIKASRRDGKYSSRVGVGFANKAGGINLVIHTGIGLLSGDDVSIVLWPNDRPERGAADAPVGHAEGEDDDIPF